LAFIGVYSSPWTADQAVRFGRFEAPWPGAVVLPRRLNLAPVQSVEEWRRFER